MTAEKDKSKGGRPQADVDPRLVEQLASIGCTLSEIAAACNCSIDTLSRRFADEMKKGRENGKTRLRKKQLEVAMGGNVTMLIWLGKQMLDQAEKTHIGGIDGGPLKTDFTMGLPSEVVQAVTDYAAKLREKIKPTETTE